MQLIDSLSKVNFRLIMHNFTNYDSHLFVKQEKYVSIAQSITVDTYLKNETLVPIVREMRFIDSFSFLQSSLDTLSKNLDMKHMRNLKNYIPTKINLN